MGFRHKYDHTGKAKKQGEDGFWTFVYSMRKAGYKVYEVSFYEDAVRKYDCRVETEEETFTTDVKSAKKATSGKSDIQYKELVMEFRNGKATEGSGWLYGKADFITFELEKTFIRFPRVELAQIVEEMTDFDDLVENFGDCTYKVYSRRGDLITKVELSRLKEEFKKRKIPYKEYQKYE
jgi:hypothetical protein